MSILRVINGILLVTILAMVFSELHLKITVERSAKMLAEEEFKETIRKAQVIDIRERDTLDAGYILGVCSMLYSMLKTTTGSLRKDQPVYLHDQEKALSIQTANLLHKNGYTDIYVLKDDYDGQAEKVKERNS